MTAPFPLGLRLTGRKVLVAGGGAVAQRRVPRLLESGAEVHLVSPVVTPALEALPLTWHRRGYQAGDLDGCWLALALTDDPAVNAEIAAAAEALRVFCVRADDASAATAWTPASGWHQGVSVAVHADRDPRRAAAIRDAVMERVLDGSLDAAPRRRQQPGVALVGSGPGDPELITVRGRRALSRADVVVVDRLAAGLLLDELPAHVEVIDAAKLPRGRSMAQQAINAVLIENALAGKYVVRLKGGDPFVFGRGGEELEACLLAGVPVELVPGVSSAFAVPAVAGIPVTHRGVVHEVVVVSGHVPPGDPRSLVDWTALGRLTGTLVLMMAVENLPAIAAALIEHGRDPATPVAAISDGTTVRQRMLTSTLAAVGGAGVRAPAIVVVGSVVTVGEQFRALTAAFRPAVR